MDIQYMFDNYECKNIDLKPYKGYEIQKCYFVDRKGKRKGKPFYLVAESNDEDYCGDAYSSLADAKHFIDSVTDGGK